MKILSPAQIQQADKYTIREENILSHQLMERAANVFTNWLLKKIDIRNTIIILCGTGNNGGDGLCVARQLFCKGYKVNIFILGDIENASSDFKINLERINKFKIRHTIFRENNFPVIYKNDIIIDAIFGTGLNRKPKGIFAAAIEKINASEAITFSIDTPSGLMYDIPTEKNCVEADDVLTFEFPKLNFLFPENAAYVKKWECKSIGLSKKYIDEVAAENIFLTRHTIKALIRKRNTFGHKGVFGHALIIAGSANMYGAAELSGKSCLVTGCGLLTLSSDGENHSHEIILTNRKNMFSAVTKNKFNAIGIGPGLGLNGDAYQVISKLFDTVKFPVIIDADALNIISENKHLLKKIPSSSILTPHPKEFERLFGKTSNSIQQLELQKKMSAKYNCIIILKRAYTCITIPNGNTYFNSTGNPGMATAGSGDVLTGILTSLLAQKYSPEHAAIIGVFLHGLAGDLAIQKTGGQNIIASNIIENIQHAFNGIEKN